MHNLTGYATNWQLRLKVVRSLEGFPHSVFSCRRVLTNSTKKQSHATTVYGGFLEGLSVRKPSEQHPLGLN